MRISVTERQTYKRCRRKWDYASYNRQSLSPIVNAPALDLGTLIHAALAEWTASPSLDPIPLYKDLSQEYFQKLVDLYTERVGCAPSMTELEPNMQAISLGVDMISNYQKHWQSPLPLGFTLIANEQSLVQDVPGTEHCRCAELGLKRNAPCNCAVIYGSMVGEYNCTEYSYDLCACEQPCSICTQYHQLECTFDGVMADVRGDFYIIERKTFSRTPSLDELDNNDQFLAYQWAATQAGIGNIVGIVYDGLLKKPKPSGVHNTIDKLFVRRTLLRNQHELAEFGLLLAQELNEMASPTLPIYKTVPWMGCQRWECQYLDLCHATSKGYPTTDLLKMFTKTDRKSHLDISIEEEQQ